jgi:MFS family permease
VLARTAKSDLMRMISYIVWLALLAPVIAALAGGAITTYGSWRWIFLINVPLGVVAFVVAVRIMPAVPPSAPPPLDLAGVALTALGWAAWPTRPAAVRPDWCGGQRQRVRDSGVCGRRVAGAGQGSSGHHE